MPKVQLDHTRFPELEGKIVAVTDLTVSADGKTLTMRTEEIQEGAAFTLTGTKQ